MGNDHQVKEQQLLEAAIDRAIHGRTGYDALMDALGRAEAEQLEVLCVRAPHETLQPDGTPAVEFLELPAPGSDKTVRLWVCLTGENHKRALSGKSVIPTAVLTLCTLFSMAEDRKIGGIVFNPDLQPNLTIGTEALPEISRRASAYLEKCREQKLQDAGTKQRPGWIL